VTDCIHPEWQTVSVGDPVRMCPGAFGPAPYTVVAFERDRFIYTVIVSPGYFAQQG
jgi:hypothetical protein